MKARITLNYLCFLGIGVLYFCALILPNLKGAQNASMLAAFEIDEYAQYPHLLDMLAPGASLYQTLRNFLIYNHYFYGYPFYFFSALSVLPIKLVQGGAWPADTALIVAALRQMISVLPMMLASFLLVKMQTRLKPLWKALALFAFLLIVPAVVGNDLWWHPDSLSLLACVAVVYFLDRDDLAFGRNFFFAAAACGVAAGLKLAGFFFLLAVPLYLIWSLVDKKINLRRAGLFSALFLAVMAAGLVVSNPLLLFPQERAEVIKALTLQLQQSSQGLFFYQKGSYVFLNSIDANFKTNFGNILFLISLVMIAILPFALPAFRSNKRQVRLQAIILAWIIPAMIAADSAAVRRAHYFLPVMVPLISILGGLPFEKMIDWARGNRGRRLAAAGLVLAAGLILFQAVQYIRTDTGYYRDALTKEETSASLAFYRILNDQYLPKIKKDKLVVYRDWQVYFPSRADRDVEMTWDLASYDFIKPIDPDLILLERANVNQFSTAESAENAVNEDKAFPVYEFYRDARDDTIPGYALMYQDDFGLAFVKTNLWGK